MRFITYYSNKLNYFNDLSAAIFPVQLLVLAKSQVQKIFIPTEKHLHCSFKVK